MENIVAWAYMVESDSGLTVDQIQKMMALIPQGKEVAFFTVYEGESNSVAMGFIDNDAYPDVALIVEDTVQAVCDDWSNESEDGLYDLPTGHKVLILCDSETILLGDVE